MGVRSAAMHRGAFATLGRRSLAHVAAPLEVTLALIKPTVCAYEPNIQYAVKQIRERTDLQVCPETNTRLSALSRSSGPKKMQHAFTLSIWASFITTA